MPSDVFLIGISKSSKNSHSHDDRVLSKILPQKYMQDPWCVLRSDSQRLEKERTCRTRREVLETSTPAHIEPSPEFFGHILPEPRGRTAMVSLCSEFVDVSAVNIEPVHLETTYVFKSPDEQETYGRTVKDMTEGLQPHICHE
jgi:hypothetical protein